MSRRPSLAVVLIGLALGFASCKASRGPYVTPGAGQRNALLAQELSGRAAAMLEESPREAEELLREALTADIFFGPAHNNLGVIHLQRGDLYEAALEFEWARKLMPGHPDPRVNLALTLEEAGQFDEALASYRSALEVHPGYLPAIQASASLSCREGRIGDETLEQIRVLSLRGESERWREWARKELAKRSSHGHGQRGEGSRP